MIGFDGKVLLLTGAQGGIARATAERFLAHGARLLLTDLDGTALEELGRRLDPTGGRVLTMAQDVTAPADALRAVTAAVERFGRLDLLVTAAGLYPEALVRDMPDDEWRRVIAVNLDGVFFTTRTAIPALAPGGAIVNIASMAGHRGSRAHAHYAAAKGAVTSFTRSLALELAPEIRVNAVAPGLIDTPMVQPLMAAKGEQLLAQTPLGRLGRADEVADAVAFLCSDRASFITGETLHVNGGLHIAG